MYYRKCLRSWKLIGIFMMMAGVFSLSAQFAGGDGTPDNPWQIATANNLNHIRNYLGEEHQDKYYIQTRDINLGEPPWNEGEGWQPIGPSRHEIFYGNYNGNGFVINGLTINRPQEDYQALFGYTAFAKFADVGLIDVNITGNDTVAGLIARIDDYTTVDRCFVTGCVTGNNQVAGIVANMRGTDPVSHIRNCYSMANVTTTNPGDYHNAGGIVAYRFRGAVTHNYATGYIDIPVEFSAYVGAVLGRSFGGPGEISNNYWCLETTGVERGGFVNMPGSTIDEMLQQQTYEGFDFHNTWHIDEGFTYPFLQWEGEQPSEHNHPLVPPRNFEAAGGDELVNLAWTAPNPEVAVPDGYNVYRDDNRINEQVIDDRQYQDTDVQNWQTYTYYATAVYGDRESAPSPEVMVIPQLFAGGSGSEEDPWQIATADQLHQIRTFLGSEHSDQHFIQTADIGLGVPPWNEGEGWEPIGSGSGEDAFQANYDGNFYTISGLTINRDEPDQALFGAVDRNGFLTRIILTDVDIRADSRLIGGIVGYLRGEGVITQSGVSGTIRGDTRTGGIAGGSRDDSRIEQCFTTGEIFAAASRSQAGGIVGMAVNSTTIRNSYSTMDVTTGERRAGGLAGSFRSDGMIVNSYSTGTVGAVDDEPSEIGGLVGQEEDGFADNSYWDMETSGMEESALGEGRMTRQMTYPYDDNTFVGWDFENIWTVDPFGINNDYPVLAFQLQLIEPLDTPQVNTEIITIDDTDYISLSWEAIEDALSYEIYASSYPHDRDWGEPITITDETEYVEAVDPDRPRFFYIIASSNEMP